MNPPLLLIEHLSAGYTTAVIHQVSLRIAPGQRIGINGMNGAGKSTLLRTIAGIARSFDGRLEIRPDCRLAYLDQQAAAATESPLTGNDVMELMDVASDQLPARMHPLLGRRLDRMSAGERQLIKAWAIIHHPADLLLLDEPTSCMDSHARDLLAFALAGLGPARGALIISHDQEFLQAACTEQRVFTA